MCYRTPAPVKSWLYVALLALLLFAFSRPAHGQGIESPPSATSEPSPLSSPSEQPSEQSPTDSWANFDSLWATLKSELAASAEDSTRLSSSLAALQIEVNELRRSLSESTRLYEDSEAARMTEREYADLAEAAMVERIWDAELARDRWRMAALIEGGVIVALGLVVALALAF